MNATPFTYHRSLAPMMWVFLGLAVVELAVVHFLVALWNPAVALALSALSLAGIGWLIIAIRSFRRLPVMIGADAVTFRAGTLIRLDVPVSAIAGPRSGWAGEALKDRAVLNMALLAYPNVLIDFTEPVVLRRAGRERAVKAVAHKVDDPAGFLSALEARR